MSAPTINPGLGTLLRQRVRRWVGAPKLDLPLLIALLAVCALGLLVLYSASGEDTGSVIRQGIRLGVGFAVLLVISRVPPVTMRVWTPWVFLLSLALLAGVLVLGEGRGAQRWLDLGVVRFQPSELLKLSLPMMVAWFLHGQQLPPGWRATLLSAAIILLPTTMIVIQPDLGTALLIAASGLFVLFLAGLKWRYILGMAVLVAAAAPILWHYLHDYQRNRIRTFINPERDPLGDGWNIIQSKIAVGSGGVYGKGWQNGTQSHLEFLPERSTDFIFAVLAEEFGLFGVIILIALYLFIIGRGIYIASTARDTYSRLLAGALAMTFSIYVLVNGGMVTGLLPVVGVPLPLISYGGTSAVTLLAGFGILMSIHRHRALLRRV